ncbi:Clp protease N-terminal domain-containing protein [Streptomyces sp. RFCAC02]|uniref:Clp protease N-terminal domain-containing protein n=1 Tax=Streptomyces sp. RFCAC02 TaxID=2499143 RepID=UPI0010223E9F|nr:Clp protease N-terminal domain-containing protein [Streptomyces sp. RFCAC02]
MFEQFTGAARAAVSSALEESRLRGDRRIGTEHLLLGVLREPAAARALVADADTARSALADLDREALAAIGIHTQGVERPPVPASGKRTPFTSGARAVLPRALAEARRGGGRRITPEHLLAALLDCDATDPVAAVTAHLGIDREATLAHLRATTAV